VGQLTEEQEQRNTLLEPKFSSTKKQNPTKKMIINNVIVPHQQKAKLPKRRLDVVLMSSKLKCCEVKW
jgi:hypothetical protein